jgi:hypothetical protein
MRILKHGKTRQILDLFEQGVRPPVIALEVEVDRCYVYRVLKAHGHRMRARPGSQTIRISTLAETDLDWLKEEARAVDVRWQDLARAMLIDAIQEARDDEA